MRVVSVTLTGTWSRTHTARTEVYDYRRMMRRIVRENGGHFEAVMPRRQPGDGVLEGTFTVMIPVTKVYRGEVQYARAAKKLFEAMMAITMCRPPKVRYDRDPFVDINFYYAGENEGMIK
jgi:hypothetical protein